MRFRYHLDGLDSEWREAGKEREAIYAHVAPRRYVFRVQAAARDGVFDRGDASFAFTLRPRWHEAMSTQVAGGLGLMVVFLLAHRWRTRALRDRERELALRVEDRTHALRREVADRSEAEAEVRRLAEVLEERVRERTAELAEEKERLAVTLRSIGDGVIATDVRGTVMLLNRIAEGLTGWTQREASGHHLAEVFSLIDRFTREPLADPVGDVIRRATVLELPSQAVLVSRDGRERLIADSAAPIRDRESRVTGAVVVFRDVTEKRKIEEHLAHSENSSLLASSRQGSLTTSTTFSPGSSASSTWPEGMPRRTARFRRD